MIYLFENMLIQNIEPQEGEKSVVKRILWVHPQCEYVYTYKIDTKRAMPEKESYVELVQRLEDDHDIIMTYDPYMETNVFPDVELTEYQRETRNKLMKIFAPVLAENGGEGILNNSTRGELIAKLGISKSEAYRHLHKYWSLGQVANAFVPKTQNRGARGKPRLRKVEGHRKIAGKEISIFNVTPRAEKFMQRGYKKFFVEEKRTLIDSYDQTIEILFIPGFLKYLENGKLRTDFTGLIPSYEQYEHYCHKPRSLENVELNRHGRAHFNANIAPKLGSAFEIAFGPGDVFLFDVTDLKFNAVSSLDRSWVLGSLHLGRLKDAFSGLRVGYYLTLSPESWLTTSMAIVHAASDKVNWCRRFGIDISQEDWPVHHIANSYLFDRGPGEGRDATKLTEYFLSTVFNNPARSPHGKGWLEGDFYLTNRFTIHKLSGKQKQKNKVEFDPGLPCITLFDAHQAIINDDLLYNNHHVVSARRLEKQMIPAGVTQTPISLWNWGIQNRSGLLRTVSPDHLYRCLLPRGMATFTKNGLLFNDLTFNVVNESMQKWANEKYILARKKRTEIEVAYDPRSTNYIFAFPEDKSMEPFMLLSRELTGVNLEWVEYDQYDQKLKQINTGLDNKFRTMKRRHDVALTELNANAQAEADAARQAAGVTSSNLYKDRKANKRFERSLEDKKATIEILMNQLRHEEDHPTSESDQSIPTTQGRYIPKINYLDGIVDALLNSEEEEEDEEEGAENGS